MNPRQITLSVYASIVIVTISAAFLHWKLISSQSATLAAIQMEVAQAQQKIAADTVHIQLESLQSQLADMNTIVPVSHEVAPVLEKLARDLQSLGVSERSLTTAPAIKQGSITQLPLNVTFRGSFASVFQWLERVNQYDRLVRVERLILRKDTSAADPSASLSVTARLDTFGRVAEINP